MEWKIIPGFEDYKVSDNGEVWSNLCNRKLSLWKHPNGYLCTDVMDNTKKRYHKRVHRLVMLAFVGKPPRGKTDINHKDGNKTNNNLSNLEYCSRSYNIKHRYNVLGCKPPRGNRNHVLTDEEIIRIRKMHKSKQYSLKEIREFWNISHGGLCCIVYKCGTYKNRG